MGYHVGVVVTQMVHTTELKLSALQRGETNGVWSPSQEVATQRLGLSRAKERAVFAEMGCTLSAQSFYGDSLRAKGPRHQACMRPTKTICFTLPPAHLSDATSAFGTSSASRAGSPRVTASGALPRGLAIASLLWCELVALAYAC